jgi:hypothetical protein
MVTEAEIEAAIEAFHQKRVATQARGWMRLSIKAALEAAGRIPARLGMGPDEHAAHALCGFQLLRHNHHQRQQQDGPLGAQSELSPVMRRPLHHDQDGERRIENDQTGFKLATSVGGVGTGERGDRVILDDPTTS